MPSPASIFIFFLILAAFTPGQGKDARESLPRSVQVMRGAELPVFFGVVATEMPEDLRTAQGNLLRDGEGLCVTSVSRFSPAEDAGIRPVDVILSVNGHSVATRPDLILALAGTSPGDTVPVSILRMGRKKELALTLAERKMAAIPEKRPVPIPRMERERFDEIIRSQEVIFHQLSLTRPDVDRIKQNLCRIRTLSSGERYRGETSISIRDGERTIVIRGAETHVIVEEHLPHAETPHSYRIDLPGDGNQLPEALRSRFRQQS